MSLSPTVVIIGDEAAEPIVPMGVLATSLGCSISWSGTDVKVVNPTLGPLEVKLKDGCPMISHDLALKLIQEIEDRAGNAMRALHLHGDRGGQELEWIKRFVKEHPDFSGWPANLKEALIELPAETNRRTRKLWKKNGVLVHAFSGEKEGYTLKRAFHEVRGDRPLMCELDLLHGSPESDLGPNGP